LRALCKLADLWFSEAPPIRVEPIHSFLNALIGAAGFSGTLRVPDYDLTSWQWVILFDTNGQLLGYTDGFDGANSTGNIFDTGLDVIMRGPAQLRRAERAKARIAQTCNDCPYYMSRCNGHHVAEGGETMYEKLPDGALRCVVAKGLFEHLETRLLQAGVLASPAALSPAYRTAAGGAEAAAVA
jgi:uncharacterized protein